MSRTITNVSDDQNSWTTDQSSGVTTNTGVVIRVITAVNDSEKIDAVNQSTGTTTSTTVVREANAVRLILSSLENISTYYENHQESARLIRNIENCNI